MELEKLALNLKEDALKFGEFLVEEGINVIRLNLFYPKIGFDEGSYGGIYPKGIFSALVVDALAGGYLGKMISDSPNIVHDETGVVAAGVMIGGLYACIAGFVGMGVTEYVKDLRKRINSNRSGEVS